MLSLGSVVCMLHVQLRPAIVQVLTSHFDVANSCHAGECKSRWRFALNKLGIDGVYILNEFLLVSLQGYVCYFYVQCMCNF